MNRYTNTLILFFGMFLTSFGQNTKDLYSQTSFLDKSLDLYYLEKPNASNFIFEKYEASYSEFEAREYTVFFKCLNDLKLFHPEAENCIRNFIIQNPHHPSLTLANFEVGKWFFNQKKYDKAIEYLIKVDKKQLTRSQNEDLSFYKGYSYMNMKDFQSALPFFEDLQKREHKYKFASYYYSGFIYYKLKEYSKALENLDLAARNEAYKSVVPLIKLNVYYQMADYARLIEQGQALLAENGTKDSNEVNVLVGEGYFNQKNYKKAEFHFAKVSSGNFNDDRLKFRYAFIDYKQEKWDKAIEKLKVLAENYDTIGHYSSYYLGLCYLKKSNKQYSINLFNQARIMNFVWEIQYNSAYIYAKLKYELGLYDEAAEAFKEYMSIAPEDKIEPESKELLTESYIRNNNYNEALAYMDKMPSKSIKIQSSYQDVCFKKAVFHYNKEEYNDALKSFDKSLNFPIEKNLIAGAYHFSGEIESLNRNYAKAIEHYKKMSEGYRFINTDYFVASRYGLAHAFFNNKNYNQSAETFQVFLNKSDYKDEPQKYSDALLRMGDCYFIQKNFKESLIYYELAIERKVLELDYAIYQKAIVCELTYKPEKAKETFAFLVDNYPNSAYRDKAVYQSSVIDFEQGNYILAIDKFTTFINSYPNSNLVPYALQKRAIAQTNIKNYNLAIIDYKEILNKYPLHSTANSALQSTQELLPLATNGSEDFSQLLSDFKAKHPQATGLENIEYENCKREFYESNYAKSIGLLNSFKQSYPLSNYSPEVHFYLAESYWKQNILDSAQIYYEKVILLGSNNSLHIRSLLRKADIQLRKNQNSESIASYQSILKYSTAKKDIQQALSGLANAYFQKQSYDTCLTFAKTLIKTQSLTHFQTSKAELLMAKACFVKGDISNGVDYLVNVINNSTDETGAEAYYLLSKNYHDEQKYAISNEWLFTLNKNYKNYTSWIGKAFLLIGKNYRFLNENYQSKSTFRSLIDHFPDQDIVELAKKELETLNETQTNTIGKE